ncbi:hypothetical protein GCM10007304_10630 [Rhodococcoides trifolii]|uniref:DUF559 domain-containing protein n=1 Tax=Rhodococcoides trifolii TaxID=908250 RepID=A0A917CUW4_9NOCA|nr:DUF559 domain-containing protein [Rhodococcus trifolii]GGF98473.1 hypothetical protein GCM10007304_10630 [Rhodococcus trifolii]
MDAALQRHTSLGALKAAHARNAGRTGAAAAGALLRSAEGGARSEAERLFARILTAGQCTGWIANYRWGPCVLDFAFVEERLAIEIDGWAFHSDPGAFQRDRTRQNAISSDWTVLRYTWADLTERPQEVLREVQAVLNRIRCRAVR